jgi:hypothetical protein
MIFVGLIIGFLFGCILGFALGNRSERPTDVGNKHRVRYMKATPMQPRKFDVEDDA